MADQTDPTSATGVTYFEKICLSEYQPIRPIKLYLLTRVQDLILLHLDVGPAIPLLVFTGSVLELKVCNKVLMRELNPLLSIM